MKLTRESLLDGTFHAAVRSSLGPGVRVVTDAERAAQVSTILARAPRPAPGTHLGIRIRLADLESGVPFR